MSEWCGEPEETTSSGLMEWQLPRGYGHDRLLRTTVCAFGGPLPKHPAEAFGVASSGLRVMFARHPAEQQERHTDVPYKAPTNHPGRQGPLKASRPGEHPARWRKINIAGRHPQVDRTLLVTPQH